jgi:hypothetical protein
MSTTNIAFRRELCKWHRVWAEEKVVALKSPLAPFIVGAALAAKR